MQRIKSEDGATAIEYSLLLVFVAAVIIGIVTTLGQQALAMFQSVEGTF